MRIVIFNWRDPLNPKSGGAERATLEHAKAWVKRGHHVLWFSTRFKNSLAQEDIDDIHIVRKGNVFTVFFQAYLFYIANKQKIDLIIDEIHGIPFFTPLYTKTPILAYIHEVALDIWDHMYPFPLNKIARMLEPLFFSSYKSTQFMTVSQSTKEDLIAFHIPKEHIHVIYNGNSSEVLKKFPQKEKALTCISLCRLVKMKGIEDVINAFEIIYKKNLTARLWIVGAGDKKYVLKLHNLVVSLGLSSAISFLGVLTEQEKLKYLRKAHILLHASKREGWGLVVIEAASQATPAVVYNVPGLRDSVLHGKTGIVVAHNSPKDLADAALQLFSNKKMYNTLQEKSLAWAAELRWEKATKESTKLIESL